MTPTKRQRLDRGLVIPACPLALEADGTWAERHQRALVRYYHAAGAGGLAVGVHSTQFAIREPQHDLYEPILRLVAEEIAQLDTDDAFLRIAGICGKTPQALAEAELAKTCGYDAGLLSMMAVGDDPEDAILAHCREVADAIPIIGFYLQPAVGGRVFPFEFWRRFAEIPQVIAIKIAPFNRYQTWDVIRAVIESGRNDIALYTGNDDNIIADLMTPFTYEGKTRRIAGGLLGQWGVWTKNAVQTLEEIHASDASASWLEKNAALTDANAVVFDAAHNFAGCIPGIMEVLRRQGLIPSIRCLDPNETLSPGQAVELDRIAKAYPDLNDDAFVAEHLDAWLA